MSRNIERPSPKTYHITTLHNTAFYVTHDTFIGGTKGDGEVKRNWKPRPKSVHEGEGERKMREFKEKILSEEQAGRGEVAKTKESTKPGMMRSKSSLTESSRKSRMSSEERESKEKGEGGLQRRASKKLGSGSERK